MSIGNKIILSVIIGWIFAGIITFTALNIENETIVAILLWNVGLFVVLAGKGPLLGYDEQGNPMYEGTPVHIIFAIFGFVSSFLIYPIMVFLILTVINKIYPQKMNSISEFLF